MVCLVLLVISLSCTVSQEDAEQAELDIADAPIELRVTAKRMYDDYETNEVAANQKYDGKVLAVSGVAEDFGGGDDSAYYIDLSVGDFTLTSVRCYFSHSQLNDLTSVAKGDRVTLRGKGAEGEDRDPFAIEVVGCTVLDES